MKKIIIFLSIFLFFLNVLSSNECDCVYNDECFSFGDVYISPALGGMYCDYRTRGLVSQKTSGGCENDFECSSGKCLSGACNSIFFTLLEGYNSLILNQKFCIEEEMFCYNGTQPQNSIKLENYTCETGSFCYKCNSSFYWDDSLKLCIRGRCNKTPGCLNKTSINNSQIHDLYCESGKCFSCEDDYIWNSTLETCILRPCNFVPGCLNVSNLSNAIKKEYFCVVGNCFICKVGYVWNNNTRECVSSSSPSSSIGNRNWNTINVDLRTYSEVERTLQEYDRIQFFIENVPYYLSIMKVYAEEIYFSIEPVLTNLFLKIGSEAKYDVNFDNKKDILIKVISINDGKAKIKLSSIKESFSNFSQSGEQTFNISREEIQKEKKDNFLPIIIISFFALIILILIVVLLLFLRKKETPRTSFSDNYSSKINELSPHPPFFPQKNQFPNPEKILS